MHNRPLARFVLSIPLTLYCITSNAAETLDLPLLDYPFNAENGYSAPSMRQSLTLSKTFYQNTHHFLQETFADKPSRAVWAIAGFDILSLWLPLGVGWLHEEWHRAVLSQHGIDSYNEIYEFRFEEVTKVSGVDDAELTFLKAAHPDDQVRLSAAGIEAQYELTLALEVDSFFGRSASWNRLILWMNTLNNVAYIHTCSTSAADRIKEEITSEEGTDVEARDFTGTDCTAWVYDLFRPDESYAARGTHPSGVGIDRYRSNSDLSADERAYLKTQRTLSYLNFIDPFLFGYERFTGTDPMTREPIAWNASVRHHLAPFGYALDINVMTASEQSHSRYLLRAYVNDDHVWPGIERAWLGRSFELRDRTWFVDARTAIWWQPRELRFDDQDSRIGGLIGAKLALRGDGWRPYFGLEAKTDGWVPGEVYLDKVVSVYAGVLFGGK